MSGCAGIQANTEGRGACLCTACSNGSRGKRMGQSSSFWQKRVRPGGEISNLAWGSPGLRGRGGLQASGLGVIAWSQCPQCAMQPICRCGQIGLCCSATSCPARRLPTVSRQSPSTVLCLCLAVWHWSALAYTSCMSVCMCSKLDSSLASSPCWLEHASLIFCSMAQCPWATL